MYKIIQARMGNPCGPEYKYCHRLDYSGKGKTEYEARRNGFTLIELLVVIVVIALLLSILMPALKQAEMFAEGIVCKSNLHQYHLATEVYITEFDGRFPSTRQSLYDSCRKRCKRFCQDQDNHSTFSNEIERYCRWHHPDYNLASSVPTPKESLYYRGKTR